MEMNEDKFLRLNDFLGKGLAVPLSRPHFYELMREGKAPKSVKLGRASVWRASEIQQWIRGDWQPKEAA